MMRVVDVWVEPIEDAGCTNGNYPAYEVTFNTGDVCCGYDMPVWEWMLRY